MRASFSYILVLVACLVAATLVFMVSLRQAGSDREAAVALSAEAKFSRQQNQARAQAAEREAELLAQGLALQADARFRALMAGADQLASVGQLGPLLQQLDGAAPNRFAGTLRRISQISDRTRQLIAGAKVELPKLVAANRQRTLPWQRAWAED